MKGPQELQTTVRLVPLVVMLGLVCNGQTVPSGRGCRNDTDLGPGVSPYELISGKPPLEDLWSMLGIPAKMRVATSSQFLAAPNDIDCSEDCKAEIVSGDSILSGGTDSIVRVCKNFGQTCRFLVLHSGSNGWRLIDYLDSPYEKYEAPTIRVEASQNRRWLVKTAFGGGGTGSIFQSPSGMSCNAGHST